VTAMRLAMVTIFLLMLGTFSILFASTYPYSQVMSRMRTATRVHERLPIDSMFDP